MRTPTGLDITLMVMGGIQLILTLALYGVCGQINSSVGVTGDYITLSNFGMATFYLLVCILAIVSGATGHSCPYTSTIIVSVFAIIFALGAAIVSTLGLFSVFHYFYGGLGDIVSGSRSSSRNYLGGFYQTTSNYGFNSYRNRYTTSLYNSYDDSNNGLAPQYDMRLGMAVINNISFCFLIPLSIVACCGMCNRTPNQTLQTGQAVGTGGMVFAATQVQGVASPGYVMSPPTQGYPMQGYPMQGYVQQPDGMMAYGMQPTINPAYNNMPPVIVN